MYLRKPLVHHNVFRCSRHRCPRRSSVVAKSTLLSLGNTSDRSDFVRYTEAEFTDALFTTPFVAEASSSPVVQVPSSSLPLAPRAATASPLHPPLRRSLHCGREVSSLPPTQSILNHLNSSLWLQVLSRLHGRGALLDEDRASIFRYLSAFTYRPLMPWLWSSTTSSTLVENAQPNRPSCPGEVDSCSNTGNEQNLEAKMSGNGSLITQEVNQRSAVLGTPRATVPTPLYTVADICTAASAQWTVIAASVVRSMMTNSEPATLTNLLRVWHDLFFALRSNAVWVGTPEQLRDCAHPQLMRLFECFYSDVRRHCPVSSTSDPRERGGVLPEREQPHRLRDNNIIEVVVRTLTPPILLRKFRSLYRPHHKSAMLFAELYALCIKEEELTLQCLSPEAFNPDDADATGGGGPATHTQHSQRITTTTLLMDVDLLVYYATLPGRRHSGLRNAKEQWAVTLQHLRFLLPRVHVLQRCLTAQGVSSTRPKKIDTGVVWGPWRQVASVLMNVCMWVSNDNAEARRLTDALRCTVEALGDVNNQSSTPGNLGHHRMLTPVTKHDVGIFISCLVEEARESMRNKAAQLNYGPTDGLLGVYLLSVVVAAVIPASVHSCRAMANRWQTSDGVTVRCADADGDTSEHLKQLRLLFHPSKGNPREVWAALHRFTAVGEAVRYGLVTAGHRLFSECVIPLASQSKTLVTAQRLWGRLRLWATEVGRPLGLHGESTSTLWQLRWLQEQHHASSASHPESSTGAKNGTASTLLDRLTPVNARAEGRGSEDASVTVHANYVVWRCGCGFENKSLCLPESIGVNPADASSVACAACVLRNLTPLSWECPSCHTVAGSGVCVPYCLCCGEAHPLASQLGIEAHTPYVVDAHTCSNDVVNDGDAPAVPRSARHAPWALHERHVAGPNLLNVDGDSPLHMNAELTVHVCSDCHAISAAPQDTGDSNLPHRASMTPTSCSAVFCTSCGSSRTGYYTAFFTWTCGCGASNSALHAYCHACSQHAQEPTVTCSHCNDVHPVTRSVAVTADKDVCRRCHHPHPRILAAIQQHRLVRCPACQGRLSSTAVCCPHCASTAVEAVAALLPTEADCPWLCHRCGTTHQIRDETSGQIKTPAHLLDLDSLHAELPLHAFPEDDRCATCSTRRLPSTVWERGRLWVCDACGERHNIELACRQCASLAPGVPLGEVHVWRCGICEAYHPSWETQCSTVGCGGQRTTEGAEARLCYSPWTCAECGEVTLSSHVAACATCGVETPADLRSTPCVYGGACGTTALPARVGYLDRCGEKVGISSNAHAYPEDSLTSVDLRAGGDVCKASDGATLVLPSSLAPLPSAVPSGPDSAVPTTRLEEVEAFLIHAASQPVFLSSSDTPSKEDWGAMPSTSLSPQDSNDTCAHTSKPTSDMSRCCFDAEVQGQKTGASIIDLPPWEDAYTAAVMSF